MTTSKFAPVGMFDSGVGGVSVLREAARLLPHEDFIYFGDTGNAPYGEKPPERVRELAFAAVEKLLSEGAKAVVIACNTATGAAAMELRAHYSFPILGMEPAIKPALSLHKTGGITLVLATPVTLKTEKYARLFSLYGEGAVSLPCPGLMDFVERGEMRGEALDAYLTRLFLPYRGQEIDAVVLGCTHYVFLKKEIERFFPPETKVIDGNLGVSRELERRLCESNLLNPGPGKGRAVFVSSSGEARAEQMRNLFLEI